MDRMSLRVQTLVVCATLLATTPVLATECNDPLDIGRGEVVFHVPSSYDPMFQTPLVIMLHAGTYTASREEDYLRLAPLSERHGFLYALPEGTGGNSSGDPWWNGVDPCGWDPGAEPDDSGYLKLLIDTIKSRCNVDPRRVYFVGHSSGALMSYRMACEHAESVSAIASLAGATFFLEEDCQPLAPVHVLQIHGTSDEGLSYDGGKFWCGVDYPAAAQTVEMWASYNRCSEPPEEILDTLDLDASLPGAETSITRYAEGCRAGSSAELWAIKGGKHFPELTDEARNLIVEHLLSRLGCSGKERLLKVKCNAKGRLLAKLKNGLGGDSYRLELSDGIVVEGRLNRKGKAKKKITHMPPGEGTATVSWGCGATARRSYRCP